MKSTPSTMPTGRAVRKLPDTTRTVALAIGVFGRPCENAASISKRNWPAASCAQSSATASVMRRPWLKRDAWPLAAQLLVHLRPEAVHQHELDAHRVQDRQVLHEGVELAGGDQLAGHRDHEGLAAVGVDVRRHRAEPGHEGVREDEAHVRGLCRSVVAPDAARHEPTPHGSDASRPRRLQLVELMTSDPNAAAEFYGKLFGWTIEAMQMGAGHLPRASRSATTAIGGIMAMPPNAPADAAAAGAAT